MFYFIFLKKTEKENIYLYERFAYKSHKYSEIYGDGKTTSPNMKSNSRRRQMTAIILLLFFYV